MNRTRPAFVLMTVIAAFLGHAAISSAQTGVDVEGHFVAPWRAWDAGYFASTPDISDGGFGPEAMAVGDMKRGGGVLQALLRARTRLCPRYRTNPLRGNFGRA